MVTKTINYKKTLLVVGKDKLKSLRFKKVTNEHLIIVIKRNVLITLYFVKDLYPYLKSLRKKTNVLTF